MQRGPGRVGDGSFLSCFSGEDRGVGDGGLGGQCGGDGLVAEGCDCSEADDGIDSSEKFILPPFCFISVIPIIRRRLMAAECVIIVFLKEIELVYMRAGDFPTIVPRN